MFLKQIIARLRLRIDPGNASLRKQLIATALEQGDMPAIVQFLHRLLPRTRNLKDRAELAQLAFRTGDYSIARDAVATLGAPDGKGPAATDVLFRAAQKNKNMVAMRYCLDVAKPARPDPRAQRQRARMLMAAGYHAEALTHWQRALDSAPGDYQSLLGLAMSSVKTGDANAAGRWLAAAMAQAASGDTGYFAIAAQLADQGIEDCRKLARDLKAAAPSAAGSERLDEVRRQLTDIRKASLPDAGTLKATFLCPIHRPADMVNAIAQITRQRWPNAEAIFAVNSPAIADDELRRQWRSPMPLNVVDCVGMAPLGAVLNKAVSLARGNIVFKIDADCFYLPNYAEDMIRSLHVHAADLATKKCKFRLMKAWGNLDLEYPEDAFRLAALGESSNGSALAFRRGLWQSLKFQDIFKLDEDGAFTLGAVARGYRHVLADPFNHYVTREKDLSLHTWQEDSLYVSITRPRILMGDEGEVEAVVAV